MREAAEDEGARAWHFCYNRRLASFSNAVSACVCSQDGGWIVSGTGSGDVRVFDTGSWAEVARLRGLRSKEPLSLVFSPSQRWLVCAYSEALYIFECGGIWKLHQTMPSLVDELTQMKSRWMCVAFSQHQEVNHADGATGHDTHLCALSATHLHVLDYSGGWASDRVLGRSRSLMHCSRPISMTYSCCGVWLLCGFESGDVQVWNAASLMMQRTLSGHSEAVTCIVSSPAGTKYGPRIVSCSKDQTLRVWRPVAGSWLQEQQASEPKSGRPGVRSVSFSSDGNWLASLGKELCVWRVCQDRDGVSLQLHQFVHEVCGSEGLRMAVFFRDSGIVAGSRDGVLGLWMKAEGPPEDLDEEPSTRGSSPRNAMGHSGALMTTRPSPKATNPTSLTGMRPVRRLEQMAGGWTAVATPLSPMATLVGQPRSVGGGLVAAGRLAMNKTVRVAGPLSPATQACTPKGSARSLISTPKMAAIISTPKLHSMLASAACAEAAASPTACASPSTPLSAKAARSGRICSSIVKRIALAPTPIAE